MKTYELHPLATIFPAFGAEALNELARDIQENGLREPITTLEGRILDGRNRAAACFAAGVEPRFEEWQPSCDADTPERFVFSRNVARRHLTDKQRGEIAAGLVTNEHGGGAPGVRGGAGSGITAGQAAEALGVKRSRVYAERERVRNGGKLNVEKKHGKTNPTYVPKAERTEPPSPRAGTPSTHLTVPQEEPPIQREMFDWIEGMYERQKEIFTLNRMDRVDLLNEFAELLGAKISGIKVPYGKGGGDDADAE